MGESISILAKVIERYARQDGHVAGRPGQIGGSSPAFVQQETPGGRAAGGVQTVGINERIYRGGQFLPSTTLEKMERRERVQAKKYMERKREVGPYEWQTPPHIDYVPIASKFPEIVGYRGAYKNKTAYIFPDAETGVMYLTKGSMEFDGIPWRSYIEPLVDAWNDGARWMYDPKTAALWRGNA